MKDKPVFILIASKNKPGYWHVCPRNVEAFRFKDAIATSLWYTPIL
jgi:hypothetical protein